MILTPTRQTKDAVNGDFPHDRGGEKAAEVVGGFIFVGKFEAGTFLYLQRDLTKSTSYNSILYPLSLGIVRKLELPAFTFGIDCSGLGTHES